MLNGAAALSLMSFIQAFEQLQLVSSYKVQDAGTSYVRIQRAAPMNWSEVTGMFRPDANPSYWTPLLSMVDLMHGTFTRRK